jgi:hypothetical protein
MRLERFASRGVQRPCLLVAPALLIAANLGVASLKQVPDAPPLDRSGIVQRHELARISTRRATTPQVRAPLDAQKVSRINRELVARRPELAEALRKAANNAPPPPPAPEPPPPVMEPTVVPSAPPTLPADSAWRSLSLCESGGYWQADSGNGYYGGLQFSLPSWQSVGGVGYPHESPADLQIAMAERLQARQGWAAWPACATSLGLV